MSKIDQALALMEQKGIDLLVATSEANIAFLTGYWSVGKRLLPLIPMFATLDRHANVRLVSGKAELPSAVASGMQASQFRFYGGFYFAFADADIHPDFREALAATHETGFDALATLNNGVRKVAIDGEGLTFSSWTKAAAVFPGADIQEASLSFKTLRLHKESEEMAILERSGKIMEEAVLLACRSFRAGQTENDVRAVIDTYVVEQGARPNFCVVASGPNGAFVDTATTSRVIGINDSIRFDVGCVYKGYHSDIARTAYTGEPSRKLLTYYDAIYRGLQAMIKMTKPGTAAADLFAAGVRVTQQNGIAHYQRNHCGHGIGREVYELPPITSFSTYTLEPGMTMCLETPYYEIGWTGIQVEDTLVVTQDGCRLFTNSPAEMIRMGN